jgi:peptide/nickel transport system substrate-binding protein
MKHSHDIRAIRFAGSGLACLLALTLVTACGGGSTGSRTPLPAGVTGTLTIGLSEPPSNFDPSKANIDPSDNMMLRLVYEPLLSSLPTGGIGPGLAIKWGFVGSGYRIFQMQLRPGVKFADGSPVTAAAVAQWLNYYAKGSNGAQWLAGARAAPVAGQPDTVRITMPTPQPAMPQVLTWQLQGGDVVSPKGLANPAALGSQSFGAGPYVLDNAATITGSQYTFTPNPNYWNKTAIHFARVVVEVLPSQSSALAALQTGQVDLLTGVDASTLSSVGQSNLQVFSAPSLFMGVNLMDRDSAPLGDVRVRQALNYAINRKAIVNALFQGFGTPSSEFGTPGYPGEWTPAVAGFYPYDPAKARALLAQAGYPHGFSLSVETPTFDGTNLVAEAVGSYWQKIGVTIQLTVDAQAAQWAQNVMSKNFPVAGFVYGGLPMSLLSPNWFGAAPNPFNPFGTTVPQITSILARAASAAGAEQISLYHQAEELAVTNALAVPVGVIDINFLASREVTGISVNAASPYLDPTSVMPASGR